MIGDEVLARLAESRRALHEAMQGLSEGEMTGVQVEGVWTVKDVLGHIASWEETCLEPLRCYVEGESFEVDVIEDYLAWNDEQAARKRDVPLAVILDELAAIRQELVTLASRLPAEQWEQRKLFPWGREGTVVEMLDGLCEHELEHVRAVQQWRGD